MLLLGACSGSNLAGLQQPSLTAQAMGTALFLRIGFSNEGCPAVDGARATLNGVALTATSLGGPAGGLLGGCKAIQFLGPPPAGVDATFTVQDDSATFSMTAPGYFAPRSLAVLSPLPLHPGDDVSAQTQPSTDAFDNSPGVSVDLVLDGGCSAFVLKESYVHQAGSTFSFVVPASNCALADGGSPGTLTLQPGLTLSQVTQCSGATTCAAILETGYAAGVVLAP
jgi:hypothetical protein